MNKKRSPEFYEIACEFIYETEKAVLILDHSTGERMWVPLSNIEKMYKQEARDSEGNKVYGCIVMSAWIAKQKGLL